MKPARKSRSTSPTRTLLRLAISLALLTTIARSQSAKPQTHEDDYSLTPAHIAKAIATIKSGKFYWQDVNLVESAKAVEAIPVLKEQFTLRRNELAKQGIAIALVRLGEKDDTFWNYLVTQATPAVESDAPDPYALDERGYPIAARDVCGFTADEHGGIVCGKASEAFKDWVQAHGLQIDTAINNSTYNDATNVGALGQTGDARAIPLLRKALLSQNYEIQSAAAQGLAAFADKDSEQSIIEASSKAPGHWAAYIAASLVYFDDPQAQAAAEKYIPPDRLKKYRAARAADESPYGIRPPAQHTGTDK